MSCYFIGAQKMNAHQIDEHSYERFKLSITMIFLGQ